MFNLHHFKKAQNVESIPGSDVEQKAGMTGVERGVADSIRDSDGAS